MSTVVFRSENLEKHFGGVFAVNQLSLELHKGQITGIIGPNGSGKSTFINLVTGIFHWDEGSITLNQESYSSVERYQVPGLGMTRTFQQVRLVGQMSVWDNLLLAYSPRGVLQSLLHQPSAENLQEAEELLKKINLWHKRFDLAENLSYGQRKLLEVVRAMAMDADIIFFDEPFAGMFSEMIELVKAFLRDLKKQGKAVVLVEHNMDIIRSLCDHILFLDSGKLMAQGTPEEVFSKPEVLEAYLGE
jgi:ABC-type branched-subunit amino acid transport system ATPase component